MGFNARVRLNALSSMAQGVGDVCRRDRAPLLVVGIVVAVERRVLGCAMLAGSSHKAGECLGRTGLGLGLGMGSGRLGALPEMIRSFNGRR